MSVTSVDGSALERFRAAQLRGADPHELLDLADRAIDEAVTAEDPVQLDRIAVALDDAAATRGHEGRGLGIAAARARAAVRSLPAAGHLEPPASTRRAAAAPTALPGGLTYAHWDRRLAAFILDWCLLLGVILVALNNGGSDAAVLFWWIVFPAIYFTILHWAFGRTLGKFLVGTTVRRIDGDRIGFGAALGRTALQMLLVVSVVGFLADCMLLFSNPRAQTLHDQAAQTIVIRMRRSRDANSVLVNRDAS